MKRPVLLGVVVLYGALLMGATTLVAGSTKHGILRRDSKIEAMPSLRHLFARHIKINGGKKQNPKKNANPKKKKNAKKNAINNANKFAKKQKKIAKKNAKKNVESGNGTNDEKAGQKKEDDKKNAKQQEEPTPPSALTNGKSPKQIFDTFCGAVGLNNALSDGSQKKTPTCSQTIQGAIPAFEKMVSTIIISPKSGDKIQAGKGFKVSVKTNNLDLGFFEDPQKRYYLSPQSLNAKGAIEGHQHVVIQRISDVDANVNNPPDARTESLTFFKGLNENDKGDGVLSVDVPGENMKQAGTYRICTITGTRGHQPVIMPVAQRGSQDDCIRVTVN